MVNNAIIALGLLVEKGFVVQRVSEASFQISYTNKNGKLVNYGFFGGLTKGYVVKDHDEERI